MDLLSGVSSILAIVSFALQLGQSALNIKQFLDIINDAPAEAIRLNDSIFQLQSTADCIKTVLERQKKAHCQQSHIYDNIYHTLKTCQGRLDLIEDAIRVAGKVNTGQNSFSRSWAQFRLACRKEKIEQLEKQLDRAKSFLDTNLLLILIDSNSMLNLEVGALRSFVQQHLSIDQKVLPIRLHRSCYPRDSATADGRLVTQRPSISPEAPVHKAWSITHPFRMQCYKTNGKHKRQSVLLHIRISRSYMISVQFSRPFFGPECSVPLNISVQNLIPTNSAILKACEIGDSDQVRLLLKSRTARPNDMTPDSRTLLGVAVKEGHEEVVQLLLREGANPDLPSGVFQSSPLQLSVYHEKLSIVRILVQHGVDVDYSSTQGWSLLHYLFDRDRSMPNSEYFSILREYASFDDIKDKEGWTALHRCAAFGTSDDLHFLHLLGASPYSNRYVTNKGWSPIHVASLMNNVSTLEALVNLHATQRQSKEYLGAINCVDIHGWTPLQLAIYMGAIDTMRWLIRHGANLHHRTYRTAGWFPKGHEGEAFQASELVKMSRGSPLDAFFKTLKEIGYDVTIDGDDIYWLSESP
ncbi:ankyrin [Rostrohypoxylon terebratum]|nr:ankyrin [Rostrohypoxylon terebratum]